MISSKPLKALIAFSLMLFFFKCNAQNINLHWGTAIDQKAKNYSMAFVGSDEDGIYTYSVSPEESKIFCHNKNGDLLTSINVSTSKSKNIEEKIINVFLNENTFVVFVSSNEKKNDKSILYALKFDKKTGEQIGIKKNIFEAPYMIDIVNYQITKSENNSKILLSRTVSFNSAVLQVELKVINTNLDILIEKTFQSEGNYSSLLKSNATGLKISNPTVDNDGSLYFIQSNSSSDNYVVSYNAKKDYEKWEERIDLSDLEKDMSVKYVQVHINNRNDLIIVGFVQKKSYNIGAIYMKIDNSSKEIVNSKINYFDNNLKNQYFTSSQIKKGDQNPRINGFFTNYNFHNKADGGIIVVVEDYVHYIISQAGASSHRYFLKDILVLNFTADGNLVWTNRIRKNQVYAVDAGFPFMLFNEKEYNLKYLSFISGINCNKVIVAFNDLETNLSKTTDKTYGTLSNVSSSIPVVYSIDILTGKMSCEKLFDPASSGVYLKMSFCEQKLSDKDWIVLGLKDNVYKIGKISCSKL